MTSPAPAPEPWKHETIEANGLKFHCVTAGSGPLLVLLHGFPQDWSAWRHQIPELAKRFRVLVPDQRGYGDSDKPPRIADYRMQHLVADIAALIKSQGATKAFVVGHDWGAAVAWALAYTHPDLVEKLVIINVPHPAKMGEALTSNFKQIRRSWYIFAFQLPWLPVWFLTKNNGTNLIRMLKGSSKKGTFSPEDLEHFRANIVKPGAARSMVNWYRAALRDSPGARKLGKAGGDKIRMPVRVIWGEDDVALGKELTYGLDRWCVGGLEITYVPGCSHWVPDEQPENVTRWITEFLTGEKKA